MTTSTLTLTEFLLARIAEKEANAINYLRFEVRDGRSGNYAIPDEIRAECEAMRRIVERHSPVIVDERRGLAECGYCCDGWGEAVAYPCPDVRDLASVYADHPDCREEWKPDEWPYVELRPGETRTGRHSFRDAQGREWVDPGHDA